MDALQTPRHSVNWRADHALPVAGRRSGMAAITDTREALATAPSSSLRGSPMNSPAGYKAQQCSDTQKPDNRYCCRRLPVADQTVLFFFARTVLIRVSLSSSRSWRDPESSPGSLRAGVAQHEQNRRTARTSGGSSRCRRALPLVGAAKCRPATRSAARPSLPARSSAGAAGSSDRRAQL